jgi:hypothetical protein
MKKVRFYVTLDWNKSVLDATKASEIKAGIRDEITGIVTDTFAESNPQDITIRFLRTTKKK